MDEIIEDHLTFTLVVDFKELNKREICDPYHIITAEELNR
jgi:hypothetical protein